MHNPESRLNNFLFHEPTSSLYSHISMLTKIIEELGSLDEEISYENMLSILPTSLSESPSPLALVSDVTKTSFYNRIAPFKVEV